MMCPLVLMGNMIRSNDPDETALEMINASQCTKSKCAWFDNEQKQCAVLSININLLKTKEAIDEY